MSVITVSLRNPPPAGNYWQLLIANASKTDSRFIQKIPMGGKASFTNIPATWDFPLSVDLIVYQWTQVEVSAKQIYRIQSYWGSGDPNYKAVFIRVPGDWYFNFSTEEFEYSYKGTITALDLVFDDSRAPIPVKDSVPQGTGRIYINIRNDIEYPEVIGVAWEVSDPSGLDIETGKFRTPGPFLPGQSQGLFSDSFTLDKLGEYSVKVEMFMTIDEFVVDSYEGVLCTVIQKVDGTITKVHTDVDKDFRAQVHVLGRNDASTAQQMGIHWIVTDPSGKIAEEYSAWEEWPYTGEGKEHEFVGERFELDKVGDWLFDVALFMNEKTPVMVDRYTGLLLTFTTEGEVILPEEEEKEKEKAFPWLPVVLIGGATLVAVATRKRGR